MALFTATKKNYAKANKHSLPAIPAELRGQLSFAADEGEDFAFELGSDASRNNSGGARASLFDCDETVKINPCSPCQAAQKEEKPCHKEEKPCREEKRCHSPCVKEERERKECKNRCKGNGDVSLLISITDLSGSDVLVVGTNEFPLGFNGVTTDSYVNAILTTCSEYRELSQASQFDPLCGCLYSVPGGTTTLPVSYASLLIQACIYIGPSVAVPGRVSLFIVNNSATAATLALLAGSFVFKFISNRGCQCVGQGCKSVCPISFVTAAPALLDPAGVLTLNPFTLSAADVAALANSSRDPRCQKKFRIYSVFGLSSDVDFIPSTKDGIFLGTATVFVSSVNPLTITAISDDGCRLVLPNSATFVEDCTCSPVNSYVFGTLAAAAAGTVS